jgi:hypothetical protein
MSHLHHLVCRFLTEAMDQGALTPTDPELLTRFLLDGLHAALLPLAHQDRPARDVPSLPGSQVLSPPATNEVFSLARGGSGRPILFRAACISGSFRSRFSAASP